MSVLQVKMTAAAEDLRFEEAAMIRDQIGSLSSVLQQQSVDTCNDTDADIIAALVKEGRACVNLTMMRGGRHLGDKTFFPQHDLVAGLTAATDGAAVLPTEVLAAFLVQHYVGGVMPPTLIINQDIDEPEAMAA